MRAGRILLIVFGVLIGLVGLGLASGGGTMLWAHATQRDDDGFFTTRSIALTSPGVAVVSDQVDLGTDAGPWAVDLGDLAEVRIRATASDPAREIFVGIGSEEDVQAYLAGAPYTQVRDVDVDPLRVASAFRTGTRSPSDPTDQTFWVAQATGPGTQTVSWRLQSGTWMVVLMNADAGVGVRADADLGVKVGILFGLGIGLLVGGLVLLGIGVTMVAFGVRGGGAAGPPASAITDETAPPIAGVPPGEPEARPPPYPLRLEGTLDDDRHLSRWVWIFKWLLGIPHYVVLFFLWIAFTVLTVIAFFAILFTGRYPRGIFEFNVGVLRWTWRVSFWSYSALGTDRYPPFSLGPEPGYPATLEVTPPERLSRGLVLVKWWLLAIPHYIVVSIFTGSAWAYVWSDDFGWVGWGWGGLIGLLVFFAAVALLFTGRYPRGIFDLVVGLNRWVFRVSAYAALMRDEYPPMRLDPGPREPPAGRREG